MDLAVFAASYRALTEILPDANVYYAAKANPLPEVLRLLVDLEACFDVASVGEIEACLAAGAPPRALSYGNTINKRADIALAYERGIRLFAFSSADELDKLAAISETLAQRSYAKLSRYLDVRTIHISERDTQTSDRPKRENEFVNTWSVEGFYEESIAPAELGWGTHEKGLPPGAHVHDAGPRIQICLDSMGCRTWVRSWVPCGEIVGMVIRHGETFSISEALTVVVDGVAVYRPTVHYAYCPCDAAIASLHELHMRRFELQPDHRIMNDDIVSGRDELGCLLMGHDYKSWWIGSLLDIHETRRLAPNQNATTLQVAASVMAAARWMLANPAEGVNLPDDLPHQQILADAKPYLGPMVSEPVDWTPLDNWSALEAGPGRRRPLGEDRWQFSTFLVS